MTQPFNSSRASGPEQPAEFPWVPPMLSSRVYPRGHPWSCDAPWNPSRSPERPKTRTMTLGHPA
eukprot:7306839-Pyramimonas_sp.AAC.1